MQEITGLEIGQRIAQARRETGGMTQDELADLVGVSGRAVQLWEAGDVVPYKKMERIATVLNRTVGWLLHGEDLPISSDQADRILEEVAMLQQKMDSLSREVARQRPSPAPAQDKR